MSFKKKYPFRFLIGCQVFYNTNNLTILVQPDLKPIKVEVEF